MCSEEGLLPPPLLAGTNWAKKPPFAFAPFLNTFPVTLRAVSKYPGFLGDSDPPLGTLLQLGVELEGRERQETDQPRQATIPKYQDALKTASLPPTTAPYLFLHPLH